LFLLIFGTLIENYIITNHKQLIFIKLNGAYLYAMLQINIRNKELLFKGRNIKF